MTAPIARFALTLGLVAGLLFGTLPATAYAAADPIPPHPPSPLAGLPGNAFNGQVVTLADGDRYEVTYAAWGRSIRGRRWDAATSTWGPRQVIFKDPDLRCWGLVARGAGSGVAVRVECGRYFVEESEGRPFAIVSADTHSWQSRRLPGYLWWNLGISPDGAQAVWSEAGDYITWSAPTGFVRRTATPPQGVYEEAPVITDDGTVTIAYADDSCSATFDTYPTAGVPTRQVLPTGPDCGTSGVLSVDAHTVAYGDSGTDEWSTARLTRPDDASPWVVAAIAPLSAPGLLEDSYNRGMAPILLDAVDRPLAVVGNSADVLRVQVYDPGTQSWRPPATLVTRAGGTKCRFRDDPTTELGFYALFMRCAGPDRFVTSSDGGTWTALPVRSQAIGTNRALGLVAVPDRRQTVVVGTKGTAPLPVGTSGGCDVVFPIAADRVLRLTAARGGDGWPSVLQRSTATGWRTLRRVRMPTSGECRRVFPGLGPESGERHHFQLQGTGRQGFARVRFVEVDGHWDVRVR